MEGTAAETKKKPPAHEIILQKIANILIGLPRDYFLPNSDDKVPTQWSHNETYFAGQMDVMLAIIAEMHIPATALEKIKQYLGTRGLFSDYLNRLSE